VHFLQGQTGSSQMWAVSQMRKNSLSHFCDCFMCVQTGVRPSIFAKKEVLHFSVRMNSTDAFS
jgi:hypothetical protein